MNRIPTMMNKEKNSVCGTCVIYTEFLCIRTAPVLCICKLFFQFIIYLPTLMYISVFYQKSITTPELPLLSLAYNILSFPFRLSPGSSGLRFGICYLICVQFMNRIRSNQCSFLLRFYRYYYRF